MNSDKKKCFFLDKPRYFSFHFSQHLFESGEKHASQFTSRETPRTTAFRPWRLEIDKDTLICMVHSRTPC
jgi:hypothetical protein